MKPIAIQKWAMLEINDLARLYICTYMILTFELRGCSPVQPVLLLLKARDFQNDSEFLCRFLQSLFGIQNNNVPFHYGVHKVLFLFHFQNCVLTIVFSFAFIFV